VAYPTYITEALVCGSTESRSADRFFLLFTKDAGMVHAHARSVREERSKQRYALQECSHIRATLVRGKSGWRIAGVESIDNLYARAETREARALLRSLMLLLRRVIHGEIVHAGIFDDVLEACAAAGQHTPQALETAATLRILHALGYVPPQPAYEAVLAEDFSFANSADLLTTEAETAAHAAIQNALLESQL
jgi:recombinational DNA repair protein (RecF pathway)